MFLCTSNPKYLKPNYLSISVSSSCGFCKWPHNVPFDLSRELDILYTLTDISWGLTIWQALMRDTERNFQLIPSSQFQILFILPFPFSLSFKGSLLSLHSCKVNLPFPCLHCIACLVFLKHSALGFFVNFLLWLLDY